MYIIGIASIGVFTFVYFALFVAFAPDEHFDAYSYGSELLTHDGAVASLVACAAALRFRSRS